MLRLAQYGKSCDHMTTLYQTKPLSPDCQFAKVKMTLLLPLTTTLNKWSLNLPLCVPHLHLKWCTYNGQTRSLNQATVVRTPTSVHAHSLQRQTLRLPTQSQRRLRCIDQLARTRPHTGVGALFNPKKNAISKLIFLFQSQPCVLLCVRMCACA